MCGVVEWWGGGVQGWWGGCSQKPNTCLFRYFFAVYKLKQSFVFDLANGQIWLWLDWWVAFTSKEAFLPTKSILSLTKGKSQKKLDFQNI